MVREEIHIDEQIDILGRVTYNGSTQNREVGADMAFDQTKYVDDYVRENYDRLSLKIPKGKKAVLKELATMHNITDHKGQVSVTRLLIEAVEEKYHIDLSKPD